jgi:hypothetical protein
MRELHVDVRFLVPDDDVISARIPRVAHRRGKIGQILHRLHDGTIARTVYFRGKNGVAVHIGGVNSPAASGPAIQPHNVERKPLRFGRVMVVQEAELSTLHHVIQPIFQGKAEANGLFPRRSGADCEKRASFAFTAGTLAELAARGRPTILSSDGPAKTSGKIVRTSKRIFHRHTGSKGVNVKSPTLGNRAWVTRPKAANREIGVPRQIPTAQKPCRGYALPGEWLYKP